MSKFTIQVSDKRNKYPTKIYSVEAEDELFAYAEATERFIKDNNHPPRKIGQRLSLYYSRFWNKVVQG